MHSHHEQRCSFSNRKVFTFMPQVEGRKSSRLLLVLSMPFSQSQIPIFLKRKQIRKGGYALKDLLSKQANRYSYCESSYLYLSTYLCKKKMVLKPHSAHINHSDWINILAQPITMLKMKLPYFYAWNFVSRIGLRTIVIWLVASNRRAFSVVILCLLDSF